MNLHQSTRKLLQACLPELANLGERVPPCGKSCYGPNRYSSKDDGYQEMPEPFNKNETINKFKVAHKCSAFENIFSCSYLHCRSKSHFLLPDRRRRPRAEEKCKADLSRSEREVLESGWAEEADVDSEVEGMRCSADTLLACLRTDGGWTALL